MNRLSAADRAWQRLLSDGAVLLLPERLAASGTYLLGDRAPGDPGLSWSAPHDDGLEVDHGALPDPVQLHP